MSCDCFGCVRYCVVFVAWVFLCVLGVFCPLYCALAAVTFLVFAPPSMGCAFAVACLVSACLVCCCGILCLLLLLYFVVIGLYVLYASMIVCSDLLALVLLWLAAVWFIVSDFVWTCSFALLFSSFVFV